MTLKLNGSSSGYTAIDAPAAAGSNTLVLPADNGSANQYLKNSGTAGTLEFASLGATGLFLNWNYTTDNTAITLADPGDIYTELNTSITPSSTASRIVILVTLGLVSTDSDADVGWNILRDSTALEVGSGGTNNATTGAFMNEGSGWAVSSSVILVDHPNTTSSVTYKVQSDTNSPRDMIINRRGSGASLSVSSRMFLMEIGNKS